VFHFSGRPRRKERLLPSRNPLAESGLQPRSSGQAGGKLHIRESGKRSKAFDQMDKIRARAFAILAGQVPEIPARAVQGHASLTDVANLSKVAGVRRSGSQELGDTSHCGQLTKPDSHDPSENPRTTCPAAPGLRPRPLGATATVSAVEVRYALGDHGRAVSSVGTVSKVFCRLPWTHTRTAGAMEIFGILG